MPPLWLLIPAACLAYLAFAWAVGRLLRSASRHTIETPGGPR